MLGVLDRTSGKGDVRTMPVLIHGDQECHTIFTLPLINTSDSLLALDVVMGLRLLYFCIVIMGCSGKGKKIMFLIVKEGKGDISGFLLLLFFYYLMTRA